MKKIKNIIAIVFLAIMIALYVNPVIASSTPPDPPEGGHGGGDDLPPGGGAPLGKGTFILISMAAAYGVTKIYQYKKPKPEEELN